jgi:hypothetical protein
MKHFSLRTQILIVVGYAVLFWIIGVSLHGCDKWKDAYHVMSENYESEVENNKRLGDGFTKTLRLTEEQFAEREAEYIDSLSKLSKDKLKLQRVVDFFKIELEKEKKNIKLQWRDSIRPGDSIRVGRLIKSLENCLKVSLYSPDNDSFAYLSYKYSLDAALVVYKGKRTKDFKIGKLKLWRYGPRSLNAEMFTNCDSAKININHINIIKQ